MSKKTNPSVQEEGTGSPFTKKKVEHWQWISFYLIIYDIIAVNGSYFLGLLLRFDFRYSQIPKQYLTPYIKFSPFYTIFVLIVFTAMHLYNSIWRYASIRELERITIATLITSAFHIIAMTALGNRMPVSYYMVGIPMQFGLTVGIRFLYRFVLLLKSRHQRDDGAASHAMIIGAGEAGQVILREMLRRQDRIKPCCMIDDNPNKWGRFAEGVPIVGGRDEILNSVKKYKIDKIYVALPSVEPSVRRDILNICKETDCELKTLPGVYQLMSGDVSLSKMKDVAVEDLLGRDTIKVNMDEIFHYLKGKTILVTGGGGSIGSELCRQIAAHEPKQLIIFDIYENNAYEIQQELKRKYPNLNLTVLIGSVRDSRRVNWLFAHYKPQIVYHAAAHKHVPLMEDSPCEAIKNNALGTYKTAYAALMNGTERFVLISTDKAVNPTNVMGASKRICEMIIQSMDKVSSLGKPEMLPLIQVHNKGWIDPENHCGAERRGNQKQTTRTEFVAVRFGNVLGSNGSVIPLFKKQIAAGGPVTVTHPDIIRYFMTIPEAVSLVLQAGTYAKGGEIFVLDMGAPVKIDTLARNLIRLSGYHPDEDIKVMYTGLRPGEKLYEEKLMAEEGMQKTPNDLIHIGKPMDFDVEQFFVQLERLAHYAYSNSIETLQSIAEIVPTYHSPESDLEMNRRKFDMLYQEATEKKDEA